MQANKGTKIRVMYVMATNLRSRMFEWICRDLNKGTFELSFIIFDQGKTTLAEYLTTQNIPYCSIKYSGIHNLFWATWQIYCYCRRNKIDIVHAHGVAPCLAGFIGAYFARVQIRIQTRHHGGPFPFPMRVPWSGVYDRFINFISSKIIVPSQKVKGILVSCDRAAPSKIVLIPYGFDLEAFTNVSEKNVQNIRDKYNIGNVAPVVGVIARYVEWKGVHYVISAFHRLLEDYPSAFLVLANARGRYRKVIHRQLQSIPDNRYVEIPFEDDLFALYKLFDVFVHVPIAPAQEAFGQVYVEALAAGIPSVFTQAGVVDEFVVHNKHAYLVDYQNSNQIYIGIKTILENPSLRESLICNGYQEVQEKFNIKSVISSLETLYFTEFETTKKLTKNQDSNSKFE